jgi:hypothetical protein
MKKYKINKNKPLPTDEKIRSHMDFNKLVGDYNKIHTYKNATNPLYKNPKFLGFIALLSTVILMLVIIDKENEGIQGNMKLKKDQDSASVKIAPAAKDSSIKINPPLVHNKIHKIITVNKEISAPDSSNKVSDTSKTVYPITKTLPSVNSEKNDKVIIKNSNDVLYKRDRKALEEEMLKRHSK